MTRIVQASRRSIAGAMLGACIPRLSHGQDKDVQKVKIRFDFAEQHFTAMLQDTATTRDLLSLLPLDLSIEDYSTNEKIAYLPRRLATEGREAFGGEAPGDLCYYTPWGNLVLYHAPYRYSHGLIRLGRLDGSVSPLLIRGTFPLTLQRA